MEEENVRINHLRFFGIPKILPHLKPYVGAMLIMMIFAFGGSLIDIIFPKFQEYAINHYTLIYSTTVFIPSL